MRFEWDGNKAKSNIERHGVEFSEAMTVFDDDLAIRGRLLAISYAEDSERIRIISAREATGKERSNYEEGKDEHR